jgi:hypothetical protein
MIKFVRGIHSDYLANVKKYRNIYTWNCWIRTLLDPKKQALQTILQHARQIKWGDRETVICNENNEKREEILSDVLKASERLGLRYEN